MSAQAGGSGSTRLDSRRSRVALAILIAVGLVIATLVVVAVFAVGGDEEVLVLPPPAADAVEAGDGVQVSGTVTRFADAADPQQMEDLAEFLGRNVLVAESVRVLDPPPPKITGGDSKEILQGHGDDLVGDEVTVVAEVAEDDLPGGSFTIERPPETD